MSRVVTLLLAFIAVSGCVPAFAVDGVVLINQASVTAAGGFPFSIFLPGSYKLSGNLEVPAETDGIDIAAAGVTLDLNGFSIRGPINCQGVACTQHTNDTRGVFFTRGRTVIRNGNITGFANGILGEGSGTVEDIHISDTASFGIFTTETIVKHVEISGNGGLGLACGECVVVENHVEANRKGGVNLGGGTFSGNIVFSNGDNVNFANAFIAATVVSAHNNACNDSGC
ncbi:MAG TPA: hypothetical protein VMH80_04505 [Bryobacteraceae bacterium]|nr:hypothetical protein [Bryobacteraceae bacterium]